MRGALNIPRLILRQCLLCKCQLVGSAQARKDFDRVGQMLAPAFRPLWQMASDFEVSSALFKRHSKLACRGEAPAPGFLGFCCFAVLPVTQTLVKPCTRLSDREQAAVGMQCFAGLSCRFRDRFTLRWRQVLR